MHTIAAFGPISQSSNDFRIGGRQCCPQFFKGKLDDVRVYNRALSATEIQSLAATNQPPTVSLTSPVNGATFNSPATITFNATASDADGSVTKVDFFAGQTLVGTDSDAPYSFTWSNVPAGSYSLTARATDNLGATKTSSAVSVTVTQSSTVNFPAAQVDPVNRTGASGEDLFSGNYKWSLPLVGLPGRAGLDLGLSLTYNSLVWTKSGSSIKFDADNGFPAPGFRLGFPVIQTPTYVSQAGVPAYLMITSSGTRVELRSVGGNLYESADSSYIQFDAGLNVLRTPDGSVLTYQLHDSNLMCTSIKDRNGNFISVAYSGGRITSVTDTLGRVIAFNYPSGRLDSITQTWNGATHTWAQFSYQALSIAPNFPGLTVIAPSSITALASVRLADGSSYSFEYAPIGQISVIRHLAPDGHELASTSYTTDNSTVDCPRISQRTDSAENWMTVSTSYPSIGATNAGRGKAILPDQTSIEEDYPITGFNKGLPTQSRIVSANVVKKTTTTSWIQDNTSLTYPVNPRVSDMSISDDAGNVRHTSITYTSFGLPSDIVEYLAGGNEVLRHIQTDYVTDAAYVSRRILGLPKEQRLYEGEGTGTLVSKVSYEYDWGFPFLQNQGEPVQHDSAYGQTFTIGRGNLSAVNRFDVNSGQSVQVRLNGYNTTGNPIFVRDAIRNVLTIGYDDSFSDGANHNTLAYPTTLRDGDNFLFTVTYNYDLGVTTKTRDPKGAELRMEYNDPAGRLTKRQYFDGVNNQAGTHDRFEYPTSGTEFRTYTLLDPGIESFAAKLTDGAGRTIGALRALPGSFGGYRAEKFVYDLMGRLRQQSNPTEINNPIGLPVSSWTPAGDDTGDWVFTTQDYDWQGRPTATTNQDQTTRRLSYGGCGCAGGAIVTLIDEVGRKQVVYHDVLGRVVKRETYSNPTTVYSTTTNVYNVRDQIVSIVQRQGTSGTSQTTSMSYDGHGRLATQHRPEQSSGTATIYDYYADDRIKTSQMRAGPSRTSCITTGGW